MVFGFTIAANIFNGSITISKGLGYLVTIPGCNFFGMIQTAYFGYITVFVAFICICRSLAVSLPLVYRELMTPCTIKVSIISCTLIAAILVMLIVVPVDLKFEYVISDVGRVGCLPKFKKSNLKIFTSTFVSGIFFFDMILLVTFIILYKKFNAISSRETLRKLKKVAFTVSLSTTVSYIVCYFPTFVIYFLLSIEFLDFQNVSDGKAFGFDAVLALSSHLYSAILPMFLIYSKSLKSGKTESCKLSKFQTK